MRHARADGRPAIENFHERERSFQQVMISTRRRSSGRNKYLLGLVVALLRLNSGICLGAQYHEHHMQEGSYKTNNASLERQPWPAAQPVGRALPLSNQRTLHQPQPSRTYTPNGFLTKRNKRNLEAGPISNKRTLGDWFKSASKVAAEAKQNRLRELRQSKTKRLIYHHHQHHQIKSSDTNQIALPSGPPPFRPPSLALKLNSLGALEKLKRTSFFRHMYRSRVYYLFMDVLQQLVALVEMIARKKIDITGSYVAAIHAVASKLIIGGSKHLKLKWPLVMLNPNFIKGILANPTFLVMLFHTIELAYMSMPSAFWLKPLVKLVKQPTLDKEEEVWWRRKRIYDVLHGLESSESQPNLKAIHFRRPGEPAPAALAGIVQSIRQLMGRPSAQEDNHMPPQYYRDTPPYSRPGGDELNQVSLDEASLGSSASSFASSPFEPDVQDYAGHEHGQVMTGDQDDPEFMTGAQEELFLAAQKMVGHERSETKAERNSGSSSSVNRHRHYAPSELKDGTLASSAPNEIQLMSQDEFNMLDPREREIVMRAAQHSLAETQLTDEMIKHQSELLESIAKRRGQETLAAAAAQELRS